MAKIKVSVTAEDIEKGQRMTADRCPIALAVHRIEGYENAAVYPGSGVVLDSKYAGCPIPEEAKDFIIRFDTGDKVKPFTFEFECG